MNSVLSFQLIFSSRQRTTLTALHHRERIMLLAFFILSPLAIWALIGFARRINPLTGHFTPGEWRRRSLETLKVSRPM
jgi:hypothetical protein